MNNYVLIVDDDPGAADAFAPMLRSHGYDVRVAPDADKGLHEISQCPPAAVVVDLHLPGLDGVAVLARLRSSARHADLPVAVVTGDYLVDDDVADRVKALGGALFFKPLWEEDLVRIVRGLVGADRAAGTAR